MFKLEPVKIILIVVLACLLWSCRNNDNDGRKDPANANSANATLISNSDSGTVAFTDSFNKERMEELGNVYLLKYKNSKTCNLTNGFYYLTKPVRDSEDLRFMSIFLAKGLLQKQHKAPNCNNQLAVEVFIYNDFYVERNSPDSWLVSCKLSGNKPAEIRFSPAPLK